MSTPVRIQSDKQKWFPELPQRLAKAAADYDLAETPDWRPLDELSSRTRFEGLSVSGESAVVDGDKLVAPGTVYAEIVYDEGGDQASFHDSFPARVFFEVEGHEGNEAKHVRIARVEIDTTSFFEN